MILTTTTRIRPSPTARPALKARCHGQLACSCEGTDSNGDYFSPSHGDEGATAHLKFVAAYLIRARCLDEISGGALNISCDVLVENLDRRVLVESQTAAVHVGILQRSLCTPGQRAPPAPSYSVTDAPASLGFRGFICLLVGQLVPQREAMVQSGLPMRKLL